MNVISRFFRPGSNAPAGCWIAFGWLLVLAVSAHAQLRPAPGAPPNQRPSIVPVIEMVSGVIEYVKSGEKWTQKSFTFT